MQAGTADHKDDARSRCSADDRLCLSRCAAARRSVTPADRTDGEGDCDRSDVRLQHRRLLLVARPGSVPARVGARRRAQPLSRCAGRHSLWVETLDDNNIPSGEPRVFLLPYSAALAAKAAAAQTEIKKGNPQGGRAQVLAPDVGGTAVEGVNIRTPSQGATPGGDPSGGGVLDPAALGGQSKSVDLIPLPKPLLPPKDDPTTAAPMP